ncbi:winged helix-turn-helix transcriptional regulator [Methanosarcina sp.]|uniref:winged helix-turn-helix transcriptional regulator n=1 Tax=Methanosarcina sp. TaxID=2213 RepID=UPI0026055D02|nr:winged helix-turn-helix transcriptional regulator [Methanosarcina sp.]
MKKRITSLMPLRIIKLQKKLILCLLFFSFVLLISTSEAHEYIVQLVPSDQVGVPINGEEVTKLEITEISYWQFLLWLGTMYILATIDLFYPQKLFFSILGYRIVNPGNVLENSSRFRVYGYIKTKPGAYISEIVKQIGLDREIVKYHIKILTAKKKIEAYKDGGKTRYFENILVYNENEKKVISALQNLTNKRIISEIMNEKCNTNVALAREIGVSRPTVSWYVKNLRETGLIIETKEGTKIIYRINPVYKLLIEKYINTLTEKTEPQPLAVVT